MQSILLTMFPNLLNNISFLKNNPGLSLVILILINSQPYCRKYILALIIITKLDEFYLIYQKLLTAYDMKELLKKCVKMGFQETC